MEKAVVLIAGALTGIGRAEAGNALADELRSLGSEAEFINAYVRNEDDVRANFFQRRDGGKPR
jgi:hypothetical protein